TDADDYVADWLVVASNGTNYGTVNYWDFKVAQHTSNYNRWASAKDLMNGWDVLYFTNPSCKYVVCNP
ncbi:MAG: hypothetical protein RSE43_08435, partial [Oscillospiraceae bacterium]